MKFTLIKRSCIIGIFIALLSFSAASQNVAGLQSIQSNYDVATTATRLEGILAENGMKMFARIDHAVGAAKIGETLRPTELVIFGNPKVGTKLMQCAQTAGIDLPMKALVWEDEAGVTWVSYNEGDYMKSRHSLEGCDGVVEKVNNALKAFSTTAAT